MAKESEEETEENAEEEEETSEEDCETEEEDTTEESSGFDSIFPTIEINPEYLDWSDWR